MDRFVAILPLNKPEISSSIIFLFLESFLFFLTPSNNPKNFQGTMYSKPRSVQYQKHGVFPNALFVYIWLFWHLGAYKRKIEEKHKNSSQIPGRKGKKSWEVQPLVVWAQNAVGNYITIAAQPPLVLWQACPQQRALSVCVKSRFSQPPLIIAVLYSGHYF